MPRFRRAQPAEAARRRVADVPVRVVGHPRERAQVLEPGDLGESLRRGTPHVQIGVGEALHEELGEPGGAIRISDQTIWSLSWGPHAG